MLGKFIFSNPAAVTCEQVGYNSDYENTLLSGDFLGPARFSPGTQKARGVFFLQNRLKKLQNVFHNWNVPKHLLFKAGTKFDDSSFNYPVFARPCPVNPRHGFVDSTLCNNAEEVNFVSAQAYKAESDAEILITKPVDSFYSAIVNGCTITFGAGNDGATAGKNCGYFYISEDPLSDIIGLNENHVIAADETPFYEFVFGRELYGSRATNLVQVRSAPKTPRVKDFVPAPVVVKTILKAEGDLLDWEALLKTVDPSTTIVDHIGGSLSSHYAIHAIVNKVPIFTTYLPELGSAVQPTVEDPSLNENDVAGFLHSFAAGFSAGNTVLSDSKYQENNVDHMMGNIVRLGLATLHNYSSIALSKDYQLLGMVLGLFSRTTFAVSTGESRYNRKRAATAGSTNFLNYYSKLPNSGRTSCYNYAFELDSVKAQENFGDLYNVFKHMKWDSSYGGGKWASCTKSAIDLFNACVGGDINKAVGILNVVINENHNGGKYLNKVVSHTDFDEAAYRPSIFALRNLVNIVDILHTSLEWSKTVDTAKMVSELKPITIEWKNVKPPEDLQGLYVKATNNAYFYTIALKHGDKEYSINLPGAVKNPTADSCQCDTCNPSQKIKLKSIPFWIVLEDGTRVISKHKLNLALQGLGLANVKIF